MIDLTPYIEPELQKRIGPLRLSDVAAAEAVQSLQDVECGWDPGVFCPAIASTVAQFLTAGYHFRSEWFRRQWVHSVCSFELAGGRRGPLYHLERTTRGHIVRSVTEIPLPENYYEERVVEEVKVETGNT